MNRLEIKLDREFPKFQSLNNATEYTLHWEEEGSYKLWLI